MTGRARPEHPIDFGHLDQYTLADEALEREVLGLFRDHARETYERLLATEDPEEWRRLIHALKGSAKGVGAWALADAVEEAEGALARSGVPDDRAAGLAGIKQRLDEACSFVETVLRPG